MKRERNPAEKRARILEAAESILNDGGTFDGFSLDKVAQQAGVSKGGLLHHFPSKESLLTAVSILQATRFEDRYNELLEMESPEQAGRKLRAYIRTGLSPSTNINPLLLSYLRNAKSSDDQLTRFEIWHNRLLDDGLDAQTVSLIRMAVDGLLYTEIIDGEEIASDVRSGLEAQLIALTNI